MRNLAPRHLTAALLLLAVAACSTDTPTAPERTPAPPPGTSPTTQWTITVTIEPRDLTASSAQPATVTVRVRRTSDGAVPANGTTAVVSASLGEFDSAGSSTTTATVSLGAGAAQLLYFAGAILGQDTIQARLENSVGSARVNIIEAETLFLTSVTPTSGPEGGGTQIRISGTAFSEPARVTVGTINATIDKVGEDSQGEFIRAITGPVFDAETFFSTEGCDTDGNGSEDGERFVPKTVEVDVVLTDSSASLPNAFTYRPSDTSCREVTAGPNPPSANFSFLTNGLTVQFFNETTPVGTPTTYTWDFDDLTAFSTATDPTHTYAVAGTYQVKLRAENESGSSIRVRAVTVP